MIKHTTHDHIIVRYHICIYTYSTYISNSIDIYVNKYVYIYIYVCIYVYVYIYTHTYIFIYYTYNYIYIYIYIYYNPAPEELSRREPPLLVFYSTVSPPILRSVYSILLSVYSILRSVYSILRSVYSILRSVYSILRSVEFYSTVSLLRILFYGQSTY